MRRIRERLVPPYYVTEKDLPGIDFCRELIPPDKSTRSTKFPQGAVGIRVDDDFWAVAVLPWEYRDIPLGEIVNELWPQYAEQAKLCPDSGSIEQRIYFAESAAENAYLIRHDIEEILRKTQKELSRLRTERSPLHEYNDIRKRAESSYFIRQYEHLLIATAHKPKPQKAAKGVCVCGLYVSDRVHDPKYLDLHAKGYEPGVKHLLDYDE